jgi:hypothetical protein
MSISISLLDTYISILPPPTLLRYYFAFPDYARFLNGSGYQSSVYFMWGRATAFEGGSALQSAKNGPVIAIFVGTSVELFKGKYLVFAVCEKKQYLG